MSFADVSCKYKCAKGYTLDGAAGGVTTFTSTCLSSGDFSITGECKPVTCGKPCKIENADRVGNSHVVTSPDTIGYRCQDGYLIQGRTRLAGQAASR